MIIIYLQHFREIDNSLWPSYAILRLESGSTLAQVMACCLTTPSLYLNLYWLLISEVLWYSYEINFMVSAIATILYNEFENYTFASSPWGQWVKCWTPNQYSTQRQGHLLVVVPLGQKKSLFQRTVSEHCIIWQPSFMTHPISNHIIYVARARNIKQWHNELTTNLLNQPDMWAVGIYCEFSWYPDKLKHSALLAFCGPNPQVTDGLPPQRASDAELWWLLYC